MKKFTKELGPGWITLVENDDYALCRLIFGDGLEVDCDEEETPLLKKGFQQIQEYWTGHRVIFTLPLAPGGSDFEREVWETVMHIPYGEHFTTPTLLAALALEDTEENRARVIKAVDDYQGLLRASVATAGNDHRLGANEAPPAVISIFLGDELTAVLNAIETDSAYVDVERKKMKLGVDVLPRFVRDTTDRNRTSPFAFTGNKFEFRMVGSSDSIACANIMLNAAVAQSLKCYADELEQAEDFNTALHERIKRTIKEHKRIIFNGNGYDDAWIREATEERGLLNLRTTPDAIPELLKAKNVEMLTAHGVYTEAELRSRYEIMLENYCKTVNIEGLTMVDMARKEILPAVEAYLGNLSGTVAAKTAAVPGLACKYEKDLISKLSKLADEISDAASSLDTTLIRLKAIPDVTDAAYVIRDVVLQKMAELRVVCDEAESITADKYWPFPTYGDLLFGVR